MPRISRIRNFLFATAVGIALVGCKTTTGPEAVRYPTAAFPGGSSPVDITSEIYKPEGDGPFPAVILLHGSGGLRQHHRDWATKLVAWGYVAIVPDSFGPRGFGRISTETSKVLPATRVSDIMGAAELLKQKPYVQKERIALLGFSHGGWTIMAAVQSRYHLADFGIRGAIAYYPLCSARADGDISVPTLVLIGEADTWTPPGPCRELQASRNLKRPDLLRVEYYPGAYHSFDELNKPVAIPGAGPGGIVSNHYVGHDPVAAGKAEAETKAFLHRLLRSAHS